MLRAMFARAVIAAQIALVVGLPAPGSTHATPSVETRASSVGESAGAARLRSVVLRGRVLLPDDRSPLGLRAHLTTAAYADSADVGPAGDFAFVLPRLGCDSLDIRIDAVDARARHYHPARVRIAVPDRSDAAGAETVRVVLVPTSFTVVGGTYDGTAVTIAVDAALALPREPVRYWRVSRLPSSRGVPVGWRDEDFPLSVAVSAHGSPLRTADSASFWATARQLERDFGRTLFRPVSLDSAQRDGAQISMSLEPDEDVPGITFITYDGRGDVYEATIAIRSSLLLSDQRIVTHELLHALGFGHAAGWISVLGNAPNQPTVRATAHDVAYAQLFYRIRRVHIEQRATHGLLESSADARRPVLATVTGRGCPWATARR
jgi:hypothetical protein